MPVNYICLGKANVIITGGSEATINEFSVGGFNASKAQSTNNENPQSASRPLDIKRDSFILGEGAGAIFLTLFQIAFLPEMLLKLE